MDLRNIPRQFNAATWFVDRNVQEGRGARVAYECGEERVTYADLFERVNRTGNALLRLDVRVEERLVLLLLDTPTFPYCFFGAIKIGAVPVPTNTLLAPQDWEYVLNDTRARVVVVSEELFPKLRQIPRERLRYLRHLVVDRNSVSPHTPAIEPGLGVVTLDTLLAANSPELKAEPTCKDDAAFWLYSSGSTGPPKACVHLQHDMVVCAERYAKQTLGIREDDRCFSVAKLFFAYGLGNGGYFSLAVGATAILWPGTPAPPNIYSVIERHRPTLLFSVPSNFAAMLDYERAKGKGECGPSAAAPCLTTHNGTAVVAAPQQSLSRGGDHYDDFDLSSLRYAVSAGEALPKALFERFKQRFGVEILDAIGSTECLHMFIANRPGAVKPGSSGQIIDGYEARILDESGQSVSTGEIGNLFVRSDATCAMYWNQHDKTKDVIQGHWIQTGDKYRVDEDGFYWYCGRSDDMLKVSGMWVSPVEIESALLEHPAVLEAAVVGRTDGANLIKPQAYIVLRAGAAASTEIARELQQLVSCRLASYKRPRWVEFVTELPKTATGKLQRFKLR